MGFYEQNREFFDIPVWDNLDWDRSNFIFTNKSTSGPFQASKTFKDLTIVGGFPGGIYEHDVIDSCGIQEMDLTWSSDPTSDLPSFGDEFDYITPGTTETDWGEWFSHYFEAITDPAFPGEMHSTSGDGPTLDGRQYMQVKDTEFFGQCSGDRLAITTFYWYDSGGFPINQPPILYWNPMVTGNFPLIAGDIRTYETYAEGVNNEWDIRVTLQGTGANLATISTSVNDSLLGNFNLDVVAGVATPNSGVEYMLGLYLHHDEMWIIYGPTGGVVTERQIFGNGMAQGRWTDKAAIWAGQMPYYGTMAFWGIDLNTTKGNDAFEITGVYNYGKLSTPVVNELYDMDFGDGTAHAYDEHSFQQHKYFATTTAAQSLWTLVSEVKDVSSVVAWNLPVVNAPFGDLFNRSSVYVNNIDPVLFVETEIIQFNGIEFNLFLTDSRDPEDNCPGEDGDLQFVTDFGDGTPHVFFDTNIDGNPIIPHIYYETRNPIDTPLTPQFDVEVMVIDKEGNTVFEDDRRVWTTQSYCSQLRKIVPMSPFLSISISQTSSGNSVVSTTYYDKATVQSTIAGNRQWRINGVHLAPMSLYSGFTSDEYADMAKYESELFRLLFKYGVLVVMDIFGEEVIGMITNYSNTPGYNDRIIDYGMTFTEISEYQNVYGRAL